jgi:hypothetical protein
MGAIIQVGIFITHRHQNASCATVYKKKELAQVGGAQVWGAQKKVAQG